MEMIDGTEELFCPTTIYHRLPTTTNQPITPPLSTTAAFRGVHGSQPTTR